MPIVQMNSYGNPDANSMDFSVAVVGEVLKVSPGDVKIFGKSYSLGELVEFTLEASDHLRGICGYLAEEIATPGKAVVVVDEVDMTDPLYQFNGSLYRMLTPLFEMSAPAGVLLADLPIRVYRFLPVSAAPVPPPTTPDEA